MSQLRRQQSGKNNHPKDHHPIQMSDYMTEKSTRFDDICRIYLDGMTVDDLKYLKSEDLINLVPEKQFGHKLLMTILVRRYLYPSHHIECNNHNDDTHHDDVHSDKHSDNHSDKHSDKHSVNHSDKHSDKHRDKYSDDASVDNCNNNKKCRCERCQ